MRETTSVASRTMRFHCSALPSHFYLLNLFIARGCCLCHFFFFSSRLAIVVNGLLKRHCAPCTLFHSVFMCSFMHNVVLCIYNCPCCISPRGLIKYLRTYLCVFFKSLACVTFFKQFLTMWGFFWQSSITVRQSSVPDACTSLSAAHRKDLLAEEMKKV